MPLTNDDFRLILEGSKVIQGDITWTEDEDHSGTVDFRIQVDTEAGWPLWAKGSFNRLIPALSFVLFLKTDGRIYGLDLGKDHHNPSCENVGEKHKHKWSEAARDKEAYVPGDITAPATDPVAVWHQFLLEAGITHHGSMHPPPALQEEIW